MAVIAYWDPSQSEGNRAIDVKPSTPLPVMLTSGGTDQDVNIVGNNGTAITSAAPLPTSPSTVATPTTSALTRPNDTTAYSQNDLVANSTTAGSVSYPTLTIQANSGRPVRIWRFRLRTDKTSGWDATTFTVRLWSAAPTYTNGDNGAYAITTGAANLLGSTNIALAQYSDGAIGFGVPVVGPFIEYVPGTTLLYWDLQYTGSASLTPAALQKFYLVAEVEQL